MPLSVHAIFTVLCLLYQKLIRYLTHLQSDILPIFNLLVFVVDYVDYCCLLGRRPSKKPAKGFIVSSRIGMKFGRIVIRYTHWLTVSDFCYDVTLSLWRSWRPPAVRCCICISIRRLLATPPSACIQFLIIADSYLFITRKLSYHKDDRAMHSIHGCPKNIGSLWLCPRLIFPKFLMGFSSDWAYTCAYKTWSS